MNAFHNRSRMSSQQGLSLVELMVAVALGIFITWGALQAFLGGKRSYSMQQALSRIQENGRMAQEFLGFDIRNAGNTGCSSGSFVAGDPDNTTDGDCASGVNMLKDAVKMEFDFGKAIYGVNDVDGTDTFGQSFTNGGLNPAPIKGTDVLVTRGSIDSGVTLTGESKANDANLTVTVTSDDGSGCYSGMCPDDILVISDCTKTKIFQATKLQQDGEMIVHDKSGLNRCSSWGGNGANAVDFKAGAKIMKMQSNFYYIGNNAAGNPALYRRGITGASVELLEGVEDMQLEFGIDKDTGDNNYVVDEWTTANKVTSGQWDSWDTDEQVVIAVRYSLLVRSIENVLDEPQAYNFNGKDYVGGVQGTAATAASDRRLRQIFTSTLGVRNRLN